MHRTSRTLLAHVLRSERLVHQASRLKAVGAVHRNFLQALKHVFALWVVLEHRKIHAYAEGFVGGPSDKANVGLERVPGDGGNTDSCQDFTRTGGDEGCITYMPTQMKTRGWRQDAQPAGEDLQYSHTKTFWQYGLHAKGKQDYKG